MKKTILIALTLLLGAGLQAQRLSNEERRARNVDNQFGYVVQTNGDRIEGNITIHFFDVDGMDGIVNMDLRTVVRVSYTSVDSRGRERVRSNSFRPRNVKFFALVDENGVETRYEPVRMNVMGNLMSSTAVDVGGRNPFFKKVVHSNGDYVAYFDPSSESESTNLSVAKRGERANLFAEILRNGRTTRSVVGDCSALLEMLERGEIPNTIEGVKTFIDLLVACR